MRSTIPLFLLPVLGACATRIPRNQHQPSKDTNALQTLRDEITRLEDTLRADYLKLASLFNSGPSPTRYPSKQNQPGKDQPDGQPKPSTASTTILISQTTTTLKATSSALKASSASAQLSSDSTSNLVSIVTSSTQPTSTLEDITSSTSSAVTSRSSSTASSSSSTASARPMGIVNSTLADSSNSSTMATASTCESLCSSLSFTQLDYPVRPVSCVSYSADDTITITGGQATVGCGTTVQPNVDLCRVVLNVETSDASETYMEVWLPENGVWNGRTMNTDNGGVNGCVHYVDMNYVAGRGFAAIGDNAGHNGSSFDGSWFADDNEVILDWVYRARHSAVVAGKEVVNQFYDSTPAYSYYIGCSAGGAQGMKSAQMYPNDFDGIIAGSAAADFNHLQAWSGRFVQLTGTDTTDAKFLTEDDWITVQAAIFDQCDAKIDGVDDGILEDPTLCVFDSSVLSCTNNATLSGCLTDTQVTTVDNVFTALYNTDGELLFPALLYGSQVDAFRLGQLSGSVQAISEDWYKYAVLNDDSWSALDMDQSDYAAADALDGYHGNVSMFNGDLSNFRNSGGKLIAYHGMADPLVTGSNSQRYYLKVAKTMGLDHTDLDEFYRYFRISGMAHCGVGGISGAGAWMFGQNAAASIGTHNIIDDLQSWVEDGTAPDTLTGTKYWYDTEAYGIEYQRAHCRFPYRNTFNGGDYTQASAWSCVLVNNWSDCGVGALPRLCNVDGSFN